LLQFLRFIAVLILAMLSACVGKFKGEINLSRKADFSSLFRADPGFIELGIGQSHTLTLKSGAEPYTFHVIEGQGTISTTGVVTPLVPGTLVVRVQDSLNQVTYPQILTYDKPNFSIDPRVVVNSSLPLSAEGGKPPYSFSVVSGDGEISSNVSTYQSGASVGTARLRVTDSLGSSSEIDVAVKPALSFLQDSYAVSADGVITTMAEGGIGNLSYSVIGNGGTINTSTGEFTASSNEGRSVVYVDDEKGSRAYAVLTVSAGTQSANFSVAPSAVILGMGQVQKFSVISGEPSYSLRLKSGIGSINLANFEFVAPNQLGTSVVEFEDGLGRKVEVAITIAESLRINSESQNPVLSPSGTLQITPSGGSAGSAADYSFTSQRGSISPSGLYTAPSTPGSDVITVRDRNGAQQLIQVSIQAALQIAPTGLSIARGATLQFVAVGGVAPYAFSVLSGGGELNSDGYFQAPDAAGNSIIEVTDSRGLKSSTSIKIIDKLGVNPFYKVLVQGQSSQLSVSGGVEPYTVQFAEANGVGLITQDSSSQFTYTAPSSVISKISQSLSVKDSQGAEVIANFVINPPLSLVISANSITTIGSVVANVDGGIGPYIFRVSDTSKAHVEQLSSTRAKIFADQMGSIQVEVEDSTGAVQSAALNITQDYSLPPTAIITGAPTGSSDQLNISASISGMLVSHYKFKMGGPSTNCSDPVGYSAEQSVAVPLSQSISSLVDGPVKLCVLGRNLGPTWQLYSLASSVEWIKDTEAPTFSVQQPIEGGFVGSLNQSQFIVSGSCSDNGRALQISGAASSVALCSANQFSVQVNLSSLAEGAHAIVFDYEDAAGNAAASLTRNIQKDVTAPNVVTISGSAYSSGSVTPNFSWTTSSDLESGISKYEYALGSSSGGSSLVAWTNNGVGLNHQIGSLNLAQGQTYYFSVKAFDGAGNPSAIASKSFIVDSIAPSAGTFAISSSVSSSLTLSPTLSWSGFSDAASGIIDYEIAIGSSASGSDIKTWTSVGTSGSAVISFSPNLTDGQLHFAQIRAKDAAGNYSSAVPADSSWLVQNDITPNIFSFTDNPDAGAGNAIESNSVVVGGFAGPLTGTVSGHASAQISKDGTNWASSIIVNPGDAIRIRLTSSSTPGDIRVAAVSLGTITSANWSVTTQYPQDPPTITSITPNSGPTAGGTSITINGNYFFGGPLFNVHIGDTVCGSINLVSQNSITCSTPAVTSGGLVKVKVTSANSKVAEVANGFTYTGTAGTFVQLGSASASSFDDYQHPLHIWTGSVMIFAGGYRGYDASYRAETRTYDPIANAWADKASKPGGYVGVGAHWDGRRVLTFGGSTNMNSCGDTNTLHFYNPVTNVWTFSSSSANKPSVRTGMATVWDGRRLYVWGGRARASGCALVDPVAGGAYWDSETDTWTTLPTLTGFAGRQGMYSVFTGRHFLIWGGYNSSTYYNDGRLFDIETQTWSEVNLNGAPTARRYHSEWESFNSIWTGKEMLVIGGRGTGGTPVSTSARYNPFTNSWTDIDTSSLGASQIYDVHGLWTGQYAFLCWMTNASLPCNYLDIEKNIFLPAGNYSSFHSAIKSGLYIKNNKIGMLNYKNYIKHNIYTIPNAAAGNSWSATSSAGALSARSHSHGVWAERKFIVYGGRDVTGSLNTGALYDPFSNSWTAMPNGPRVDSQNSVANMIFKKFYVYRSNAESGIFDIISGSWSALPASPMTGDGVGSSYWTGDKWVILSEQQNAGAIYSPRTSTWSSMNMTNAPSNVSSEFKGGFVWTGTQALYFGGRRNGTASAELNSYSHSTNTWTLKSSGLSARERFAYTWSGTNLLVWGGHDGNSALNTGGSYDETTNAWSTFTTGTAPAARANPYGIWIGKKFLVWGGDGRSDGGLYDPAASTWTSIAASSCLARENAAFSWSGFVGDHRSVHRYNINSMSGDPEKMFLFGGSDTGGNLLSSGCIYNPPD
jgi:hypothetical protein